MITVMKILNLTQKQQQLILDYAILRPEVERTMAASQGQPLALKDLDLGRILRHLKVEAGGTTNNTVRRELEALIGLLEGEGD